MTQKVAAGFVIFRNTSANRPEFLMLQTSYGEHHWTPPKGTRIIIIFENISSSNLHIYRAELKNAMP